MLWGAQNTERGFVAKESESLDVGDFFPFARMVTEVVEVSDYLRIK